MKVRSAGPDREPFSSDDIVEQRMAMNFKGLSHSVGKGAGKGAGDVARETAKGTIEGIKEGFTRKKKVPDKEERDDVPPADDR